MPAAPFCRAALIGVMIALAAPAHAQTMFMDDDDSWYWPGCPIELTDHRIRQVIANEGFSNIYLNVRNDDRIQVRATQGAWVYLLDVDTCTGEIMYGQRLRPAS